jgi:hypothetical protein
MRRFAGSTSQNDTDTKTALSRKLLHLVQLPVFQARYWTVHNRYVMQRVQDNEGKQCICISENNDKFDESQNE